MSGAPIPYLDCVDIYNKLADRVLRQTYVNSTIEVAKQCTSCGYHDRQTIQGRELTIPFDAMSLADQIGRASDQGYVVSRRSCSICSKNSFQDTHRFVSFGDVLLCHAPEDALLPETLSNLLLVQLPPGAQRTRGGTPSALLVRAIHYHWGTETEEHHVVADIDQSCAGGSITCHYDPLQGVLDGPPPDKYRPSYLVFSPIHGPPGKCDKVFKTNLPKQIPQRLLKTSAPANAVTSKLKVKKPDKPKASSPPEGIRTNGKTSRASILQNKYDALAGNVLPFGSSRQGSASSKDPRSSPSNRALRKQPLCKSANGENSGLLGWSPCLMECQPLHAHSEKGTFSCPKSPFSLKIPN